MIARPGLSSPPTEVRRAALAAAVGVAFLLVSWGLLHAGFYERNQIVDTPTYQRHGEAILDGGVPYRDFLVEYPPGALPVFVIPSLAGEGDYRSVFEWLMFGCGAAAIFFVALALSAAGATEDRLYGMTALVGLAPLALGSLVLTRYDLWPAALTVAAVAALVSDRVRLGFGALGLAVAAKLYPAVLIPLALVYVGRRHGGRTAWTGFAVLVAVLAAAFVPFAVVAPDGLRESLERQVSRPLQIESLGAALLLAAHLIDGTYVPSIVSSFGSQNLDGSLPDAVATVLVALQVAAIVGVWLAFAAGRAGRDSFVAGSAAAVAAAVAFGKVLSPQFLVWLVPLVPLVAGRAGVLASGLLVSTFVVTQAWFPYRYWDVVALRPAGWLVLARDLLLVALFAVLAGAIRRRRGSLRSE